MEPAQFAAQSYLLPLLLIGYISVLPKSMSMVVRKCSPRRLTPHRVLSIPAQTITNSLTHTKAVVYLLQPNLELREKSCACKHILFWGTRTSALPLYCAVSGTTYQYIHLPNLTILYVVCAARREYDRAVIQQHSTEDFVREGKNPTVFGRWLYDWRLGRDSITTLMALQVWPLPTFSWAPFIQASIVCMYYTPKCTLSTSSCDSSSDSSRDSFDMSGVDGASKWLPQVTIALWQYISGSLHTYLALQYQQCGWWC